jgi:hypothetical protein
MKSVKDLSQTEVDELAGKVVGLLKEHGLDKVKV